MCVRILVKMLKERINQMNKLTGESPSLDFRTLIALKEILFGINSQVSSIFKSKKQYETFIKELIEYLLTHNYERDLVIGSGGTAGLKIDKDKHIIGIDIDTHTKEALDGSKI